MLFRSRTLKNITIDHSQTNIFLFYMEYCTVVKAYVVDSREERALRDEREAAAQNTAQKPAPIPPPPTPTVNAVHTP